MTIKWFVSITSEQNWHCDGSHISSMIFCKWLTNFSIFSFYQWYSRLNSAADATATYSYKATLFLGWSHRYEDYTVVIINWLTAARDLFHKWRWIFFLTRSFPLLHVVFLYHQQDFYRIWLGVTRLLYNNKKTATGFPGFVSRAARVVPLEWNRK